MASISIPLTTVPTIVAATGSTAIAAPNCPRLVSSVMSVVQLENAESFPMLPKKLISASTRTTITPAATILFLGKNSSAPKAIVNIPQNKYPKNIKGLLLPFLSDSVPQKKVEKVVAIALTAVIQLMMYEYGPTLA